MSKEYNVWQEVAPPEGMRKSAKYKAVLSIPVTQSMADVICKLMEVEYPGEQFCVSIGKPLGFNL